MVKDNEAIGVAMNLAIQGNHYDMAQDFCSALKYYEASIEKLMPLAEGQESFRHCINVWYIHTGEKDVIKKKALTSEVSTFLLFIYLVSIFLL